jgi:hypothetical protein
VHRFSILKNRVIGNICAEMKTHVDFLGSVPSAEHVVLKSNTSDFYSGDGWFESWL